MLVVAGETIVDMIERPKEAHVFDAHLGGGPYNVAKAAAKMGQESGYLSPLSEDDFGGQFVAELTSLGVRVLAPRSKASSGLAIVKTDSHGHPSYAFYRDEAADRDVSLPSIKANFPSGASIFYVGGLALADGADADIWAEFASIPACTVFSDPNIRPSFIKNRETYLARLERVYAACDILKLSDEDVAWLAPGVDPADYVQDVLHKHGIAVGLLTRGSKGADVFFKGKKASAPAPKIAVVDTVGAGDCFSAAAIAEITRSGGLAAQSLSQLQATLRYAVAAAAINCMRAGANAPTHAEVLEFLQGA